MFVLAKSSKWLDLGPIYRVVEWFPKDERNEEDGEAFKMDDTEPLLESLWQRESHLSL
jgi:hypothetical protein